MSTIRDSQNAALASQFESVSAGFRTAYGRLGVINAARRPSPDSWSVAECVEHLRATSEEFFPLWTEALDYAKSQGLRSAKPRRLTLFNKLMIRFLEPPALFGLKTAASFNPRIQGNEGEVLPRFLNAQTRLLELLKEAEGLATDQVRIASPFDARVKYSVFASFHINAAHQRRHLWQANRAAAALEKAAGNSRAVLL